MHIGIDLDNTILDATASHLHYYNQESGLSLTADDVNDFYLYRMYGWTREEIDAVYERLGHDIHWHSSPLPMAVEALQQLYSEHRLSFITARPTLFRDVTIAWLQRYGISYHQIAFTENKLQQCMENDVDVLIDDGPHYAVQLADAGIPVILIDQPYNRSVAHNLVLRAASWPEVQEHLARINSVKRLSSL